MKRIILLKTMKKLYFLLLFLVSISAFAQTYSYTTYNTSNSAIGSNYIADIKTDANGLLWIATYNGISTFNGTTFTNYNTTNSGIASNSTLKIEIDGLGRKWIASQFNGIILYNGTTWTNYTTANSGLPNNEIFDIAVDGQNNLWVSTAAGLTRFNGTTWTTYNALTNINSIAIDSNNGIWVTNNSVLYKFNGTDYNFVAQGAQKILRIANNIIYVKGSDSLMTLTTSGTNITFTYQSNSCLAGYQLNALDVDSNSKVWIGFNGQGVQNFTNCTTYTKLNTNSGLPDNYFSAIRTPSSGTIWLGTLQLGLVKMAPQQVVSGCWQSISAGYNHSLGIKTDGTLWAWGMNDNNQLGDGTTTNRQVPTQIGTNTNWKKVVAGIYYSMGIKTNGTLWAWGNNASGQLGDGTTAMKSIPTQIGTSTDWADIALGNGNEHTLALKTNGTLWAWGNNSTSQLGDGTTTSRTVPTQIGTATNWATIAAGTGFSLATKTNGTLWSWGWNNYGQLGDGTIVTRTVPTQIGTDTGWTNVAAGYSHSVARNANAALYTWGRNDQGQLGDGTNTNRSTPGVVSDQIQSIEAGWYYTVGIRTTGNMFASGQNSSGQLGNNTTTSTNSFFTGNATDFKMISAGSNHTLSIDNNGFLKVCGSNDGWKLGDGTTIQRNQFVTIACPVSNLAVEEISTAADNVKVFPNPVNDILNVSSDQKIISVTIYNMVGQQMLTKVINDNKGTVDVSALSSGVYVVKINAAKDIVKTVKVIKR